MIFVFRYLYDRFGPSPAKVRATMASADFPIPVLCPLGLCTPCGEVKGSPRIRHGTFARGGLDLPPGLLMKYRAQVSIATSPDP